MTRHSAKSQNNDAEANAPAAGAVVLLSGGIDSYTTAGLAQEKGFRCYGLTVMYGQRHSCEIEAARRVAESLKVTEHKIIELDLRSLGGSVLTGDGPVPKMSPSYSGRKPVIPSTYVPARNTILLSLALAWAEVLGVFDIFIGANAVDYSGYPDCRAEFIGSFEGLANLATKAAVEGKGRFKIHAPVLYMTKSDIIKQGVEMGLDYSMTHSCYDPDEQGHPCGQCDSCLIRLKGFDDANLRDPVEY